MTFNPPDDDDDGPRGYGKPPKAHQFKPGQSGNPRGRPKERKCQTLHDAIRKRLQEPVTLTISGKRKTMTRVDLIVTQLLNKAANADIKATETIIKLERNAPAPAHLDELSGAADRLAQKLWLIHERQNRRAEVEPDVLHQGSGEEAPSVIGEIAEIEAVQDGTGEDNQGGVSALQVHSPQFASNSNNQSQPTEGGGSCPESESSHHSVERMKNEE